MAKTLAFLDKASLRQKGWKLFALVLLLQVAFMALAYFIY